MLKGYDPLLNIVLDDCIEYLRDPDDPYKLTMDTRPLGLVVCRGTAVTLICPMDGMESILEDFGLAKLSVRDNGSGVEKQDVPSMVMPHTTSKLRQFTDLSNLQTGKISILSFIVMNIMAFAGINREMPSYLHRDHCQGHLQTPGRWCESRRWW